VAKILNKFARRNTMVPGKLFNLAIRFEIEKQIQSAA
jgi:hypothetical protein